MVTRVLVLNAAGSRLTGCCVGGSNTESIGIFGAGWVATALVLVLALLALALAACAIVVPATSRWRTHASTAVVSNIRPVERSPRETIISSSQGRRGVTVNKSTGANPRRFYLRDTYV